MRELLDTFTGSVPSGRALARVIDGISEVTALLAEYAVDEAHQVAGCRLDLPGRAQALVPVFEADDWDESSVRGRLRFGRFHMGRKGAAHGGAISLAYDDVLGTLANPGGKLANSGWHLARTAYLKVDFLAVTPIERELTLTGRVARQEGRKLFPTAEISDGETICNRCEALFVTPRPPARPPSP
jgi:acyl-coenzyme A thioesterase PaaI-like protein